MKRKNLATNQWLVLLLFVSFMGTTCTKVSDPLQGWGNKVTLTTGTAANPITSNVQITNSTISCNVSALTGKERGVCWSENSSAVSVTGSKVASNSGTGTYNATLTNLLPGKTYYYCSYIILSAPSSALYGPISSFSVPACPTLNTTAATSITTSTATTGGNIINSGGSTVLARGVVFSSSTTTPTLTTGTNVPGGSGTGSFTSNLTGLTAGVTYHVRAYATNAVCTWYGDTKSFTTTPIVCPTITTSPTTSITNTTATLNGSISATGGATIIEQGFVYSNTNSNPTVGGTGCTFVSHTPVGLGNYPRSITGLTPSSTYYVKACARNTSSWCYGNMLPFQTPGGSTVSGSNTTSVPVPDNSATGASSSINIIVPSGRSISAISVTFNMTHSYPSDMAFNLRAPNGQILNLFNRHGGTSGGNFVNTTISSTGTANLSAAVGPFTNNYAPTSTVGVGPTGGVSAATTYSALYSTGTGGAQTWTLLMRDYVSLDIGTLTSWSITITHN
ncbi:MAG: hypothetical protein FJX92_02065 [Bacteroidetes bacterium]|nr:hypothetical protein [Bacteroidota bacterium]